LRAADVELLAVDLDGTLVDSAPDIAHCVGAALAGLGFPMPGEVRTRRWIGDGLEQLIARALAHTRQANASPTADRNYAELHTRALGAFLDCYRENLFVRSRLYPGVADTLDALRKRGITLCCITNKRFAFSEQLLALAGIRDRFELLLGGDSLPEKKPSPLPLTTAARTLGIAARRAALVGDSVQDLRAARAAGFSFAWAAYGYCAVAESELGDSPRIERFADLAELVGAGAARNEIKV
jgi:phosphoglycolate phosphatase